MKFYFVTPADTELAAPGSTFTASVRESLLERPETYEARSSDEADVLILNEPFSFKEWRYVDRLKKCRFFSRFAHRIVAVNCDDAASGLLRGLYAALPKHRFIPSRHAAVPYASTPNEWVYQSPPAPDVTMLASWRGNTASNPIRSKLVARYAGHPRMRIEATSSWMNHPETEKLDYVRLIQQSSFSLCPAGWAPVSFRIYESMALGRCPVILADGFVPPEGLDWARFAIFWPQSDLRGLEKELLRREPEAAELGKTARSEWARCFAPDRLPAFYANAIASLARPNTARSSNEEIARWNGFRIRWVNGWTLPQRLWRRSLRTAAGLRSRTNRT